MLTLKASPTTAATTIVGQEPDAESPLCPDHDTTVPRRTVLRWGLSIGAGISGLFGASVGFAPSAIAAPTCNLTSPKIAYCYPNFFPCIGPCNSANSCCTYGSSGRPDTLKCCSCYLYCGNGRVVVYQSGKNCYYCCQSC